MGTYKESPATIKKEVYRMTREDIHYKVFEFLNDMCLEYMEEKNINELDFDAIQENDVIDLHFDITDRFARFWA